ncbi:Uncharacterised protein [Bacteroides thetaiotaomicron]|uniref:Uncharacterized protein n=1 Tax=Bacteroides thetaiotaomicron TaxID=818 RepID=A0A174VZ13_BACT4|nr:Uncharacterised protein [Bacteroides thetaiotaomicron]
MNQTVVSPLGVTKKSVLSSILLLPEGGEWKIEPTII